MKEIILKVDKNDRKIGEILKDIAHDHEGILHRAFLIIIFNKKRELLLAKRSRLKRLWPDFWDGSIASHPRKNETTQEAVKRRVQEEIGVKVKKIQHLFKFYYNSSFGKVGSEKEICHIFQVKIPGKISPDKKEISEFQWMNLKGLQKDIKENSQKYTPWFLILYKKFLHNFISQ